MNTSLNETLFFASPIYSLHCPEFLHDVIEVAENNKNLSYEKDPIYPMEHSFMFQNDPLLEDFKIFILNCGMSILESQGYYVDDIDIVIGEMWMQIHNKFSSMDYHTHGLGSQISGFYILECDENSSKICFHDPRPGKLQGEIREKNIFNITHASRMINFVPEEGMLYFSNSWIPHSFTRNASDKPFKFIHFNMYVIPRQQESESIEPKGPIII